HPASNMEAPLPPGGRLLDGGLADRAGSIDLVAPFFCRAVRPAGSSDGAGAKTSSMGPHGDAVSDGRSMVGHRSIYAERYFSTDIAHDGHRRGVGNSNRVATGTLPEGSDPRVEHLCRLPGDADSVQRFAPRALLRGSTLRVGFHLGPVPLCSSPEDHAWRREG